MERGKVLKWGFAKELMMVTMKVRRWASMTGMQMTAEQTK